MWWRTILTAVAISCTFTREIIVRAHGQGPQRIVQIKDVICMLLWSGLQKEDLDVKTLEKLNRYNVNIDDMNNEQQRQECSSEHITTEVQKDALGTFENKQGIEKYVSEMYPNIEKLLGPDFDKKLYAQHDVNTNKSKDNFDLISEMPDLGNVTKVQGNKGTIKIEYDIHNQQDIESVMKVWTKLSRSNSSVVSNAEDTILSTTSAAPSTTTEEEETNKQKNATPTTQPETHNNGYVHSREMEYISKILSQYLASSTIPTTTQRVSMPKIFLNDMPTKYWKLPSEASVKDESNRLNEQRHETNKINNIPQDARRHNSILDETKNMPFDVPYDTAQVIKRFQVSPYSQTHRNELRGQESKPGNNNNPIGFLLNILQMNNALYNNGVLIPEIDSTAQTVTLFPNKNNEPQEKSKPDNLFHLFQNINYVNRNISKKHMMNNVEPTIVPINVNMWGSVHLNNENINEELKALPINKRDEYQVQNLYNQFVTAPFNVITTRSIYPYGDDTMITSEPEQIQKFYSNNNRIVIPPDINTLKLHQNSYMDPKRPWFQDEPPKTKNSNSEYTNNEVIEMNARFNKIHENENINMFSGKKALATDLNDAFRADSRVLTKREPDFYRMNSINNLYLDNGQYSPIKEERVKPTVHINLLNANELKEIPANIIKEIAEKVQVMVLKHIEVSTTAIVTTISTTIPVTTTPPTMTSSTTTAPTTASSTSIPTTTTEEKPTKSLQQEFSQTNQVIQKLMEIFKELKAAKETTNTTSEVPQITTTESYRTKDTPPLLPVQANPQLATSFNPYHMQNHVNLKRIRTPIGVPNQNRAPQYTPPLNVQPTKDSHLGAITVQTNSNEIPPLAVQLSKPLKFVSQNIILTTKRPVDILKEEQKQSSIKQVEDKLGIPSKARNHREEPKHQSDLPAKYGRLLEDIKKHGSKEHNFYKSRYMNREKPWYNHEYTDNEKVHTIETTHDKSRFPDFHYPGRVSHLNHLSRPRELNLEDLNHSTGYTRPGLTELGSHQSGARHHTYSISNYDHQTRYEPTKFHEKLERVRDWPQSLLNDFPQENSDEIPGRQQMPLTKVKQRTRHDDSHFKNFLKSQQKVTDMLEKILANHPMNSGQHSVETQ